MGNQHAYAVTSQNIAISDSQFTWSDGSAGNRAYLHDARMDQVFSTNANNGGVNVVIDMAAAINLNAIALLNSNIASFTSPTIKVDAADDAAITVNVVNAKLATTPNSVTPREREHVLQFAAVSKRFWRITWTWTGTQTLTLGEIYMALTTQPQRYCIFGDKEVPEYLVHEFDGYTGESRAIFLAGPIRKKTLMYRDLSASERDDVLTILKSTKGGALPMLWCHLYEATSVAAPVDNQDVILCRIRHGSYEWTAFDFQRYDLSDLLLESLARDVGH